MRRAHQHNPLHRIECWTGDHFRNAELWEVGIYLLVRHLSGSAPMLCDALRFQMAHLESFEKKKDLGEQQLLRHAGRPTEEHPGHNQWADQEVDMEVEGPELPPVGLEASDRTVDGDAVEDDRLLQRIEALFNARTGASADADADAEFDDGDPFTDSDQATTDDNLHTFQPYLQQSASAHGSIPTSQNSNPVHPSADALDNSYVRVIHTNGVHHLAMVSCRCRGIEIVSSDLIAGRLMPTSFQNIKTLFTIPLLDHFRLCNLELKSSAYQFYQLVRRMTCPLAPASVVNLYHELRRMSRLWRWMKKLKWAGYGHNKKDPQKPDAGELANFCPACPQPGINLENGWDADADNFIYRRTFVADGNFKADHVAQKGTDLWLYDGGGMGPNQRQYFDFLKTAIESSTVSIW